MTKIGFVILAFVALAIQGSQQCPCNLALNFPGDSVSEYGISRGLGVHTPVSKISACFWVNIPASYVSYHAPTMVSYASSASSNEFFVVAWKKGLVVARRGRSISSPVNVADNKDHHVCVTWDFSYGTAIIYVDGVNIFERRTPVSNPTIPPDGIWIIGQDQDTFGGGFAKTDSMKGLLAEVNVWDRILCPYEITALASTCGPILKGNVKSQNDFEIKGGMELIRPSCCN